MHDPTTGRRRGLLPPLALVVALGTIAAVTACGDDDSGVDPGTDGGPDTNIQPQPDTGTTLGNGSVGTIVAAANDAQFLLPLDATPSPDGKTVYFVAIATAEREAAIWKANASGGGVTKLFGGAPLASPVGITISGDGNTLYIADPTADIGTADSGRIFSMPAAGGTPAPVANTDGFAPRGVEMLGNDLYFTGQKAGVGGVYKAAPGQAPTALVEGAPFTDPSGIAVSKKGEVFVLEIQTANPLATVFKVTTGSATPLKTDLAVGYPAGIALVEDDSAVLVSALNPQTQKDIVYRVEVGNGNTTSFDKTINAFEHSAGLHRARNADIYAWADSLANGTGTVYVLSK